MSLTISESATFKTSVPEGTFDAVCVGMFDLGTQASKKFDPQHKIAILWELPDVKDPEGFPVLVHEYFTASLHNQSNLKPFLESWRGKSFSAEELLKFDLSRIAGHPCQVVLIHNKSETGSIYANVKTIIPWSKGKPVVKPSRTPMVFDMDKDKEIPGQCPDPIKKRIEASPEWKAKQNGTATTNGNGAPVITNDQGEVCPF